MSSPENPKHWTPSDKSQVIAFIILLGVFLITTVLWNLESWQRPALLARVAHGILLAIAIGALLAMAGVVCFTGKSQRRWRMALVLAIGGITLVFALRPGFAKLAQYEFEHRFGQYLGSVNIDISPPERIGDKAREWIISLDLFPRSWFRDTDIDPLEYLHIHPSPLLANSRPLAHRAMVDSMFLFDVRANHLMMHWPELLPSITGADVTLEVRQAWLPRLNALREDPGLSPRKHQAAIFCMALVVLTDPEAFADWREPVRDAMLQMDHPLPRRQNIHQYWVRTIDTLLALDPPESWAELAQPWVTNPETSRNAINLPLRGVAGNFDTLAAMAGVDGDEPYDPRLAFEIWQSLGISVELWPEMFDAPLAARIREWRRDTLFRWLMAHGDGTRDDFMSLYFTELRIPRDRAVLDLTPGQQSQLAAKTREWVQQLLGGPHGDAAHPNPFLKSICLADPYLTPPDRDGIHRSLIPIILQPERFHHSTTHNDLSRFDDDWAHMLWHVEPLLDGAEREILHAQLAPMLPKLSMGDPASGMVLCVDAWSSTPMLNREQWLALALFRHRWQHHPADTPRESLRPTGEGRLPILPLDAETARAMAGHLVSAREKDGGRGSLVFHQSLIDGLGLDLESRQARSSWPGDWLQQLRRFDNRGHGDENATSDVLRIMLCDLGMMEADAALLQAYRRFSVEDLANFGWRLSVPASEDFARAYLGSPKLAAIHAAESLGYPFLTSPLHHLVETIERSPPDQAVVQLIWETLRDLMHDSEHAAEAQGALFRLSHLMPLEDRLAMRRDFKFVPVWAFTNAGSNWQDENHKSPLLFLGGGIGIPWEDDALSAEHSWSSNLTRQLHIYPNRLSSQPWAGEVFTFLADVSKPSVPDKARDSHPPAARLTAPLPPTPWQRARELHLRRPDLKF